MCGEKCKLLCNIPEGLGSPPRVRGKAQYRLQDTRQNGITPACAGKRPGADLGHTLDQDHPRVCGEKPLFEQVGKNVLGSPPRVRGKD